jgi:hypothetical protein
MLILDNILCFPVRGLNFVFREVQKAVLREQANEAAGITKKLSDLYRSLESGRITEQEFDTREKVLLDRLEELEPAPKRIKGKK